MVWTFTPWGYEVGTDEGEAIPPVIGAEQLAALTQGRFGPETEGVDSVLAGVSSAIRAACGWHVAPSLPCRASLDGGDRLIALPALVVTGVESVSELGVELGDGAYEWAANGLLRRCQWRRWAPGYRSVSAVYEAGIPAEAAADLAVVAAQVASNALSAPAGVRQESAGDVSITYNQTGSGVSGGVRLLDSDLAMLAHYRIERTWS